MTGIPPTISQILLISRFLILWLNNPKQRNSGIRQSRRELSIVGQAHRNPRDIDRIRRSTTSSSQSPSKSTMPLQAFLTPLPLQTKQQNRAAISPRRRRPTPHVPHANTPRMRSDVPVPLAPRTSEIWELDFYSRPVVGIDGKKLWELIITDASGSFEHVEAIPNSLVNSRELRRRVQAVIDVAPRKPSTIRFFRSQMFNMINIALSEIDVLVSPSRKTYALYQVIRDREKVYREMPGFQESLTRPSTFMGLELKVPQPLPDALRCESFAFGSFPLGQLEAFFEEADPKEYFGENCLVDPELPRELMVPGMIIFSKRAKPLSAWISGIELAFVKATLERQEIVFECGLNTIYKFAQITEDLKPDVRKFQTGKETTTGIHFLAVQKDSESDEIDGMWLLCESV